MTAATSAEFVELLRRYRVLEPAQLEEVEQKLAQPFSEATALGRELLQRGWLTPYQINQIGQGKAADLRLGNYVVLERLGEGGMGAVLKARHDKMRRIVALKVIRKERLANPDAVKRFQREVHAAAQLNHPSIVQAHDADEANGTHFLAMEYVEGKDLAQLVKERGPLPVEEACAAIRQTALGLQHAHEQGLVHRDIKPANLLRTSKGDVVKILDMGIARLSRAGANADVLTQEGSVMGSLDYIAPEQAMDSHTVDIRADLYSLGCTFYYLLTGRVPFPGGEALAKLAKHQSEEAMPVEQLRPDVPSGVAGIVRKLMAKKPDGRYQTPVEVVAALTAVNESPASDQPYSTSERWAKIADPANTVDYQASHRRRWPLRAGALVIGGLLVGAIVLFWHALHGTSPDIRNHAKGKRSANGEVRIPPTGPLPAKYKNSLGMEFVLVPRGKSWLGGGNGKPGTQKVEIKHDFYLGVYEVTQEEWTQVMGTNPSTFKAGRKEVAGVPQEDLKRFPVETVSWNDAQEFIKRINEKVKEAGWVYRLPTEAEWEYACRGGPMTDQADSAFDFYLEKPTNQLLPAQANFKDSGLQRTCKVGSYPSNRLGLYDMHGNVWEWCDDEVAADPKDPKGASRPVIRGGSWGHDSGGCQAAYRAAAALSARVDSIGLRLARVPVGVPAPANAPFDAQQARAHQEAWAQHLGTTVDTTNSIGMKLALIPPGKFLMGSPPKEPGRREDEGPQHEVEITRPFYTAVHDVTVGQFRAFVKATEYKTEAETSGGAHVRRNDGEWTNDPKANWQNPGFEQTDEHPVVCVSWNDARRFCGWLSEKAGEKYDLPTEAQWEYSCRAGSRTQFFSGDADKDVGDYAWYSANSGLKTHPVGQNKPNAWGLYDMTGNVRQWCQDWYDKDYYKSGPSKDPEGPSARGARVLRGSFWNHDATYCRSAYRFSYTPSIRNSNLGFRVVLLR